MANANLHYTSESEGGGNDKAPNPVQKVKNTEPVSNIRSDKKNAYIPKHQQSIIPKESDISYKRSKRLSSKKPFGGASSSSSPSGISKKPMYEQLRDIIIMMIDLFKTSVKKNANTYSIADFINLTPTKTTMIDGKSVVQNMKPLKKGSFTYIILYSIILIVFSIIPAIIMGLTLYYFISLMNIPKWFKKKMFYGDDVSYKNLDDMYHIFRRFYLNDYTLYIIIICIFYIAAVIYMSLSSYVNYKNETYRTYNFSVYALIGLCLAIVAIHLAIYYSFIQQVGRVRDRINNTVYNHINMDYVDYLSTVDKHNSKCTEECEMKLPTGDVIKICSCEPSLIELNSLDSLHTYLTKILNELESKASPNDISTISVEAFKQYKNENGITYYDLILDSTLTFYLLMNFANTKYKININRSFLENRTPLIATINNSTNILYDYAPMKCTTSGVTLSKCLNRDIDGKQNKSPYMLHICEDIQNIVQDVRKDIGKLKNMMGLLTVSLQFWSIMLTLIVCIIYYSSFTY